MAKPDGAKFVWCDAAGEGRNLYACFRRAFSLKSAPQSAILNLFADTAYQLFVNGDFVEFGPVRFDPRYPMYDTVDIASRLRKGRNVVAVSVNSFQHRVFKSIANPAGFVAWGSVETKSGAVSLNTEPGLWRCTADGAHARYVGKFSFSLNAADLFDQSGEAEGWKEADFDDKQWPPAVPLAKQTSWGPLAPRSIPYMSGQEVPLAAVRHVLPLTVDEDWYSFAVPMPSQAEDNRADFSQFIGFTTWIYSPLDQEVTVGTFWGDNWLNGVKVPRGTECTIRNLRINQIWPLKKGWNHLFGFVNAYQDIVEQYFALPRGCGLIVSADRDPHAAPPAVAAEAPRLAPTLPPAPLPSPAKVEGGIGTLAVTWADIKAKPPAAVCAFKHSRPLTTAQYEQHVASKPRPFAADDELAEIGGWVRVDASQPAQSPSRELSWDRFDDPVETLKPESLAGHVFRRRDYPNGFSLLLDLGSIHLVHPRIHLGGVAGATVDLAYTEHLCRDGMHLRLQHHYAASDRVLCSRDELDWMPSHPRGFQYLMLTVRHAARDVTLRSVAFRSASYPVEAKGRFVCSDALLTAVWEMGKRTQATNMEDAYVDCVGRERGMYGRDTIIQYHVNLAAFGDQALMGRCMQLFGQSPDATGKFRAVYPHVGDYTIADFALDMVEGYLNYYENSGDLSRVRGDWEAILRNLQWFHDLSDERKDRLLDGEWHLKRGIKAHYGGFHGDLTSAGYMSKKGVHCSFTCTYLVAMQSAMRLAQALSRFDDQAGLKARAAVVADAIREKFWDEGKGCYADNLQHETHSVHASLLAVRAGVVTRQQLPLVRKHVADQLRSIFLNGYGPSDGAIISPNYAFYLLDGIYKLGLYETAEHVMRQGWGWMLAQGLKTCAEYFTLDASLCHAWSASPTYYLSRNVLGVRFPKAPDLNEVEIDVRTHGVTHAEGEYPHPKGAIKVKWHTEDGKRVFDYATAPRGVKVKIVG